MPKIYSIWYGGRFKKEVKVKEGELILLHQSGEGNENKKFTPMLTVFLGPSKHYDRILTTEWLNLTHAILPGGKTHPNIVPRYLSSWDKNKNGIYELKLRGKSKLIATKELILEDLAETEWEGHIPIIESLSRPYASREQLKKAKESY